MAPTSTAITTQLTQLVYYHLENISYDNALFFAERLVAHNPRSAESAYLIALSYFRLGDHRSAYEVSKQTGYRGLHLGCAYIFAQVCLVLERFRDGITALEKSKGLCSQKTSCGKHNATSRASQPDAASVACLLGKLYRAYGDKKKAIVSFEDSLKSNPFMWDAFTALCDMGVNVRTPNIFKVNESLIRGYDYETNGMPCTQKESTISNPSEPVTKKPIRSALYEAADPFEPQRANRSQEMLLSNNLLSAETGGENDFMSKIAAARSRMATSASPSDAPDQTPTGPTSSVDNSASRPGNPEPPRAPARKTRAAQAAIADLHDAPKMSYRLGSTRAQKERVKEEVGSDITLTTVRPQAVTAEPERAVSGLARLTSGMERKRTVSGHPVQPRQQSEEPGPGQRRSARLNMFKSSTTKANSGASTVGAAATRELKKARPPLPRIMRPGSSGSSVGRAVSGNRKPVEEHNMDVDHAEAPRIKDVATVVPAIKTVEVDVKVEETLRYLLDLLRKFGTGYLALSQFQCQDALQAYTALPRAHQDTPWVLAQVGKAYYEQAAYADAEKYYRRLRILAPTRLQDMEVYSTILWFLKRETDLSFLAHELVDATWLSPEAWCAFGNAWSLARDHESALKCFKRATQLNPKFAYAFTLQGHEHVANEEYEKALTAYRNAVSADRRHYNAYYGIGRVYEKLGNYDKAYTHFHAASIINPTNAVLISCIGTVLEKQRQTVQALQFFSKATELAPRAAQVRYKKARALFALNQLEAAHKELMILKDLAPDEATIHFLLGKLYKTLNDKGSAVRHFTIALNLDPKASSQIKEAIESLEDDDGLDDSMMQ